MILIFNACNQENNPTIEKNQIYVSSTINPNTQEPFHEVLVQHKDTLWKHDFWKNEKSFTKQELEALKMNDELVFSNQDTIIKSDHYTLFKDPHFFRNNKGIYAYIKTSEGQKIQAEEFAKLVEGRVFKTSLNNLKTPNSAFQIQEKIYFSADEITYFWEYYYADKLMHSETETISLSYFEVEGQLFIIPANQENPYPIYQVVKTDKDEIELAYFTDFETKIKSYKSTKETDINNYETYALCKDSFQSLYYVGEDVRYAKGMEHLLNQLQEDAPQSSNEGFVNIHFTVNCNGKVGRIGLELLDRNYQPTNFEPELIQHIVDKVKKLEDFTNLEELSYRGAKDAKLFFLIQITNQQIVEVCP